MNTIIHKNINENNRNEILNELNRLRIERSKYNIHNIPKPSHLKRADFSVALYYTKAKDTYYESYIKQHKELEDEINRLSDMNTQLVFSKKKEEDEKAFDEGTFYKADDLEYLQRREEIRKLSRQQTQQKYYERNKNTIKKITLLRQCKEYENKIKSVSNEHNKHLITSKRIISPLCCCGKRCDVINFKNFIQHTKLIKHQLFKSIIQLVYYKRQGRKIKTVIDKINDDLIRFKKTERIKNHKGESVVAMNKTDKEIIQLYNDMFDEIDENKYIIREPYINKVEYNNQYQDRVLLLKQREVKLIKR